LRWTTHDIDFDVMRRFLVGEDVLGVLPTGSGKSLTFQIPALLRPGLTLVVSPLVALMRDEVRGLHGKQLTRVAAITSGQPQSEQEEVLAGVRAGKYKLLYVSPERLWSQKFRSGLRGVTIDRVAIERGALRVSMGPLLPTGVCGHTRRHL
jgi:ATP-dependent DNA helicase RecQ